MTAADVAHGYQKVSKGFENLVSMTSCSQVSRILAGSHRLFEDAAAIAEWDRMLTHFVHHARSAGHNRTHIQVRRQRDPEGAHK
jgi:hypothetical protein